jgi:hypothetical protein
MAEAHMSTEEKKGKVELAVFEEFIQKAGIPVVPDSITKPGKESLPDIFCILNTGEQVAYELVEICAQDIAATLAKIKAGGSASLATSDPTERTLRKKLHKTYKTNIPIELLCYTNGRTVSTDDMIVSNAQLWANAIDGPFRKVWLLGEKGIYEVWSYS